MYLSVDGGGSKIAALCYDDNMRLVCTARSGGVNPTQNTEDAVLAHIKDCLHQLSPFLHEINLVDEVFVGGRELFEAELYARTDIDKIRILSEPVAGIIAGACRTSGILALSGTGSDVFIIQNGKVSLSIGGWGPLMGDQGSGAWIGIQALRAVGRQANGWGEKTLLTELLSEHFASSFKRSPPPAITKNTSPYALSASLVPLVARAAHEGDTVALTIFRDAGRAIGIQLKALFERYGSVDEREIILCGGAWKAHPLMKESCEEFVRRIDKCFTLKYPCFEHVLAGPALRLLEQGMSEFETRMILAEKFPDFIIDKGGIPHGRNDQVL